MGNFDREEPTVAAWKSLRKLVVALSLLYDIDPFRTQTYFRPTDTAPYITTHTNHSIVGHQDAKHTSCPGEYVYERL